MSTNVTGSKEARDTGDDTVMPSVADHQDDLVSVEGRSSTESGQLCTQRHAGFHGSSQASVS